MDSPIVKIASLNSSRVTTSFTRYNLRGVLRPRLLPHRHVTFPWARVFPAHIMSTLKRKANTQTAGSDAKKPKQNGSITSFFGAPKTAASKPGSGSGTAPEPAGPKFDKAKWVAGLTPEQRTLLKLEIDTLHESWLAHLKDEITTKEFLELKRFLDRETAAGKKWFPPKEDVYSW